MTFQYVYDFIFTKHSQHNDPHSYHRLRECNDTVPTVNSASILSHFSFTSRSLRAHRTSIIASSAQTNRLRLCYSFGPPKILPYPSFTIFQEAHLHHAYHSTTSPEQGRPSSNVSYVGFRSQTFPLIFYRWAFLEEGVDKVMRDLREGVDMGTVSQDYDMA